MGILLSHVQRKVLSRSLSLRVKVGHERCLPHVRSHRQRLLYHQGPNNPDSRATAKRYAFSAREFDLQKESSS